MLPERLLMSLMYFRLYITQALLGYPFDLDASNVNRETNGRMLLVLLSEALPVPARDEPLSDLILAAQEADSSSSSSDGGGGKRKRKGKKIGTLEELLEKHPEFNEIFIDGTPSRSCQDPRTKIVAKRSLRRQTQEAHRQDAQVLSTRRRLVLHHVCRHVPGRVSDLLVLLRATGVMRKMPKGVVVRVDKGYEGIEEEYPKVRVEKPKKARRGQPLTVLEKILNRAMSALRMPVEHAIGHPKKYRLLAGIYRG